MGEKKDSRARKGTAAEQSVKNAPRTGVAKGRRGQTSRSAGRDSTATPGDRPPCEKCGQVHTKCNGHTRHGPNAGKPCGANPPRGQYLCVKHGGNNPTHRAKGRERMEAMVVPFIDELRRIVLDADTDASVKIRGIQILLDRTGYGPGSTVTVQGSPFDAMLGEAITSMDALGVDRSTLLPAATDPPALASPGGDPLGVEDYEQHSADARTEAWREFDAEDAEPYATKLDRFDPNVVKGEVVRSADAGPFPPDPPSGPSEFDRPATRGPR